MMQHTIECRCSYCIVSHELCALAKRPIGNEDQRTSLVTNVSQLEEHISLLAIDAGDLL